MKVKRVFKTKLPLLNGGKPQYTLKNLWKLVGDNVTKITKPKYRTGGGAMGDRVDLRINMRLCASGSSVGKPYCILLAGALLSMATP